MERGNMPHHRTTFRSILTRSLALTAMLCIYAFSFIGSSALLLGASSTPAQARGFGGFGGGRGFGGGGFRGGGFGGFRGGGFRGGGFRGAGLGIGLGLGLGLAAAPYGYYGGYGYPYYGGYDYPYGYAGYDDGGCYLVSRRIWTPYGWRIRRYQVCN
jgi:hypothetical protein